MELRLDGVTQPLHLRTQLGALEVGLKGVYSASTRAFAAPRGLRPEIARVLEAALQRAILNPEVLARMEASNLVTRYASGAEFAKYWKEQEAQIRDLIKQVSY